MAGDLTWGCGEAADASGFMAGIAGDTKSGKLTEPLHKRRSFHYYLVCRSIHKGPFLILYQLLRNRE